MCSACEVDAAEVVCFCDSPLATLCLGQWLQKHRSIPKFRFEMPVNQSLSVTRDNFSAAQNWAFGLNKAQQALSKNIAAIFAGGLEIAFGHIEREIATLKGSIKRL